MITLETGSGPKTWKLYDLWTANGKPSQIIVAAFGPATCKIDGFRWTAISGEACAAGAITLREEGGRLVGQVAGCSVPAVVFAGNPTIAFAVDSAQGTSLAIHGVDWWTASRWAKAGDWVRRKVWSDTSHKMRFEAGPGTANAVAVFQGASLAKRTVTNADFGAIEFGAIDWIVPGSPAVIDLTNSMLYTSGRWSLTHSGRTVTSGGTGGGSGSTGGTTGTGTTTTPVVTPAEAAASAAAAQEGIDTYCQRTLTRVQWNIAANTAVFMAGVPTHQPLTDEQEKYFQTNLLRSGVDQMINASGSVTCAAYYEKLILSFFNLNADGEASSQGEPGAAGSQWYHGESNTENPSNGIGVDGDYFLLSVPPNEFIIYFKENGSWTAILGTPF